MKGRGARVPTHSPHLPLPAGKPHVPHLPGGRVGGAAGGGLRLAGAVPHNSLEDEDAGPGVGAAARCQGLTLRLPPLPKASPQMW